jgi:hypothetical protein
MESINNHKIKRKIMARIIIFIISLIIFSNWIYVEKLFKNFLNLF